MAAKRRVEIEEVEEVEDTDVATGASGFETGMIVVTTLALLVGIVFGLMELGKRYGSGPFAG